MMFCLTRNRFWGLACQNKIRSSRSAASFLWDQSQKFGTGRKGLDDNVTERTIPKTSVQEHKKPLTNSPFINNLFLGKFDTKVLIFPEALSKDELEDLNRLVGPIQEFMNKEIISRKLDETQEIPTEVLKKLKEFGLFGQQIPLEYGGLGLNATKLLRLAEVYGQDESIGVTLMAHHSLGLQGIVRVGTEDQKALYLPKLASGEQIAAFCLTEANSGSDVANLETRAMLSDDGKTYILNGEKLWVTNGDKADVFIVFAKTKFMLHNKETADRITAFIVERAFGGVTNGKPIEKSGIKAASCCSVHFENTPVPAENVLGGVGEGIKVAVNVMNNDRFLVGSLCIGVMKKLLGQAADHAIKRKQFGSSIKDFGFVQEKISRTAMSIYALESLSYLTAGMLDSFVHPNVSVESACIKVFASEAVCRAIIDCMQVMGANAYTKEMDHELHLRNSLSHLWFQGTNDILRIFIAISGFQHAGSELVETVRKLRDPLNNFGFALRTQLQRLKTNRRNPSLSMKLHLHVHPDLSLTAEDLELKVVKLKYMVEKYLTSFAHKTSEEQLALKRFADIAINLLVCSACLARATRSKCIGLRNHDHEVVMARTICVDAMIQIDRWLAELDLGKFWNGDENHSRIAEKVCKSRGYAAEHPLTRNW